MADFGAVADNKTNGTKAFRAAAKSGCSEILVPPGVWMTCVACSASHCFALPPRAALPHAPGLILTLGLSQSLSQSSRVRACVSAGWGAAGRST